jgi:hypothetical protein
MKSTGGVICQGLTESAICLVGLDNAFHLGGVRFSKHSGNGNVKKKQHYLLQCND